MRILIFLALSLVFSWADFIRDGNIVEDNKTKLLWQDDTGVLKNIKSLDEAKQQCKNLSLQDKKWRLPSYLELLSIVDYGKLNPSINPIFENLGESKQTNPASINGVAPVLHTALYWTSTPLARDPKHMVWTVDFMDGHTMGMHLEKNGFKKKFVRCVSDLQ